MTDKKNGFTIIHNFIQITLWSLVLFKTLSLFIFNNKTDNQIEFIITLLRVVQTFQSFDIIFNLMKITSGSLLGSTAQVLGRLAVAWYILDKSTPFPIITMLILPWSISDIIRYSFYIAPNTLTGKLRYS